MSSQPFRPGPAARIADPPGRLHAAAVSCIGLGALASFAIMMRAGQRQRSTFVIAMFFAWVGAPFAVLAVTALGARHWSRAAVRTLDLLSIAVAVLSVFVYAADLRPSGTPNAFLFVAVPPVTCGVIVAVAVAYRVLAAPRAKGNR
jgi:hypothetical protein